MTSRRSRHRHHSPEAGPLEDDDLLREILLRLPPQPSSLPRASLVCKRWRVLVSDPGFSRRFRRHHRRNPPLLGFFDKRQGLSFVPTLEAPNRVPPDRFSPQRCEGDYFQSLGCRHGLVLILNRRTNQFLVWDTVTSEQHRVTTPLRLATLAEKERMNGAVLRAAGEIQQFHVVLAVVENIDKQHKRALACVYSSGTDLWGDVISTPVPSNVPMSDDPTWIQMSKPAVMVGDSLYWTLFGNFSRILEFDLEKQSLALIRVPLHVCVELYYQFSIMRAEGGGLGLLLYTDRNIQLWERKTDCDGVASWRLGRTIEVDKLLSLNSEKNSIVLVGGFAEENNVVFLWTCGDLFMVYLESLQFKRLSGFYHFSNYNPLESIYTADVHCPTEAVDFIIQFSPYLQDQFPEPCILLWLLFVMQVVARERMAYGETRRLPSRGCSGAAFSSPRAAVVLRCCCCHS